MKKSSRDTMTLRDAFIEAMESIDAEALAEQVAEKELPPYSKRGRIRMNRIFRERVGGTFLPFPEVDNFYERLRSKIVIKLKLNRLIDFLKGR